MKIAICRLDTRYRHRRDVGAKERANTSINICDKKAEMCLQFKLNSERIYRRRFKLSENCRRVTRIAMAAVTLEGEAYSIAVGRRAATTMF